MFLREELQHFSVPFIALKFCHTASKVIYVCEAIVTPQQYRHVPHRLTSSEILVHVTADGVDSIFIFRGVVNYQHILAGRIHRLF